MAVRGLRSLVGTSEPGARAIATIALRGMGLGLIGILLTLAFKRMRLQLAAPLVLVAAPLLAVIAQWINYGYFPIAPQLRFGVVSAILGALAGMVLRRSWMALVVLVILAVGLFTWGTSTGVPDDLYEAARATGLYVLLNAEDLPKGDDGFATLLHDAFTFAEDNSHGTDAVQPNRAAILALGVILGEDRVAKVAKRQIDLGRRKEIAVLRKRITLRGRRDLSQHFWVSAALAVVSDQRRSMTVGIAKEMMDATPGGSGFSFVDLMADRAGILFADAATKNGQWARAMQMRIWDGVRIADFLPEIQGLPEGISRDEFKAEYGGLGGAGTRKVVEEIQRRLATCGALQ
jgi:uncharacterized protein YfiM (DUF2279 family)